MGTPDVVPLVSLVQILDAWLMFPYNECPGVLLSELMPLIQAGAPCATSMQSQDFGWGLVCTCTSTDVGCAICPEVVVASGPGQAHVDFGQTTL